MKYLVCLSIATVLIHPAVERQGPSSSLDGTAEYSQLPFEGIVPRHFQGNNLHEILDVLSSRSSDLEKDQYETKAEHQARVLAALPLPLTSTLRQESVLAFVFPTDEMNNKSRDDTLETTYDSEKGKMRISVKVADARRNDLTIEKGTLSLPWASKITSNGKYIASNTFGATVEVSRLSDATDALAFHVPPNWGVSDRSNVFRSRPLFIEFTINASKAKLIASRMRVLIICTAYPDNSFSTGETYGSPTFDSPISLSSKFRYLHVLPIELWVFDTETGEVIAKSNTAFPTMPKSSEPDLLEQPLPELKISPIKIPNPQN